MKRFFALVLCVLVLVALCISASAEPDSVEDPVEDIEAVPDQDLSMDITIDDSVSGREVISELISQLAEHREPVVQDDDYQLVDVSIRSVNPILPSGDGSLKDTVLDFVGDYDAIVVEYTYQNSQGMNQYLREIQPDYPWMISVAVLVVFIFCLFRLGGALLCRR